MPIHRMQWKSKKEVLNIITGKPCRICGKPATCAIRDWGFAPVCFEHAKKAKRIGYTVDFPENEGVDHGRN